MKKNIYTNIISIIVFFLLPWFYLENQYKLFSNRLIYAVVSLGVIFLLYKNITSIKQARGKSRLIPIFFLIFPLFIIFLALYSKFFLFFNYKGL